MAEIDSLPHTERYEAWLNQCAETFKDPAWAKAKLARFIVELREEENATSKIEEFYGFGGSETVA